MKNLIVLTVILSGLTNIGLADDHVKTENKKEPSIYVVRHIEVEVEKAKEFEDAVAEKTQKYNRSEGSDLWFTYKVLTGPRTGQYARLFGVSSWADLDKKNTSNTVNIPRDNEESAYWLENITPLQKNANAPAEVWLTIPGTKYNNLGEGEQARYGALYKWKMKPGMYQKKTIHETKMSEALAASGLKFQGQVMRFDSGGDYMAFGRWIGFNTWEEFGKFREWGSLGKIYEAKHGEGTWVKYLEGWNAIHQDGGETETEYLEYLEDLSSIELKK